MRIKEKQLRAIIREALKEIRINRFNFSRDPYGEDYVGPGMFGTSTGFDVSVSGETEDDDLGVMGLHGFEMDPDIDDPGDDDGGDAGDDGDG